MWSSRLFWRLIAVYVTFSVAVAAFGLYVVYQRQKPFLIEQTRQRLLDVAQIVASDLKQSSPDFMRDQTQERMRSVADATKLRITIINADGTVLTDSHEDPSRMANHLDRPEIHAAAIHPWGTDHRVSQTLGDPLLYVAVAVRDGDKIIAYARIATELTAIEAEVASVVRFVLVAVALTGAVAGMLTYFMVGRIIRRLASLTQTIQAEAGAQSTITEPEAHTDQIGSLGAAVGQMRHQLAERLRQLQENNARLSTVMSNMVEGVLTVDGSERLVLANAAGRMLLDFASRDIEGRPLWEVTRSRILCDAAADAIRTGEPVQTEFETTGPPRRTLTLRASPLIGESSRGALLVLHDVSELRRLENLRRDFVANVSHELKTPLASIKAYAETLRMGAVNDPDHNLMFVGRIEEQAERLHQLILDLLQIAAVESGQQAFEITAVTVPAVVEWCVTQYAAAAAAKRIQLTVAPSPDKVAVRADEEGLRTILSNLIDNAIKYTPEGGSVTIRWRRENQHVAIEVQDTGIGIAKQHHARVFERFYRVDKARSRELGGTGLGLSIVKHLAQAFGGSVGLDSQPRQGSTFRVHLLIAGTL